MRRVSGAFLIVALSACDHSSGIVDGQPFEATSVFTWRSFVGGSGTGLVPATGLRFINDVDGCADSETGMFPLPSYQVSVFLVPPVTAPSSFTISTDFSSSQAAWDVKARSGEQTAHFDTGTVDITSVTADELDGTIDISAPDGSHVGGSFRATPCANVSY